MYKQRRGIFTGMVKFAAFVVFVLAVILAVNLYREKPKEAAASATPSPSVNMESVIYTSEPAPPRPTVTQGPDLLATAAVLQMQATNNAAAVQTEQAQAANEATGTAAAYTATKNAVELEKDAVTVTVMVANITATKRANDIKETEQGAFFVADLEAHKEKLLWQNTIDVAFRGGLFGIIWLLVLVLTALFLAGVTGNWKPRRAPKPANVIENEREPDEEKVIRLWLEGKSKRHIEQTVFGYTGGEAYEEVTRIINAYRFPYPDRSSIENTVLQSSSSNIATETDQWGRGGVTNV